MTQTVFTNPLELAKQIGFELYGEIGKMAFEELELCYASKLSPKTFPDTKMRAFVNLNFCWSKSYYKNTLIEDFTECIPADFAHRKITSASRETMFGSITQKGDNLVTPLFWGYEMCSLPELTAFLGSTDLQDKSNTFNEILEGNETTRDLLKFGSATEELIEAYAGKTDGLRFDGRSLSYIPNTCFIVGTRPLDNKTYTYLDESGFWSRFHTIQIEITDVIATNIFTGSFTPTNISNVKEMKTSLASANQRLFDNRKETVNRLDYEEVLLPALQQASDLIQCKAKSLNIGAEELINTRLKGDIAREVNAYRILTDASNQELLTWITGRLQHFFDFTFNPIIARDFTVAKVTPIALAFSEVKKFTKDTEKTRQEIVDEMKKQGISEATIDRALKAVKDKGLNKGGYGVYKT
jgi:hypothetical protein